MRKAKELIGKQIINQATGDRVAVVHDVVFDAEARRIAALLINTGGWFGNAQVVPWSRVASVGDVVMVQGEQPLVMTADAPEVAAQIKQDVRITGTAILNDAGEHLGTVGDLFIDDAGEVLGFEVKQGFMSGGKFLPAGDVQAVGKDAIIATAGDLEPVKEVQRADRSPPAEHAAHTSTAEGAPDERVQYGSDEQQTTGA